MRILEYPTRELRFLTFTARTFKLFRYRMLTPSPKWFYQISAKSEDCQVHVQLWERASIATPVTLIARDASKIFSVSHHLGDASSSSDWNNYSIIQGIEYFSIHIIQHFMEAVNHVLNSCRGFLMVCSNN